MKAQKHFNFQDINQFSILILKIGFDMEAKFDTTSRGTLKLVHNSFEYYKNQNKPQKVTNWRCTRYRIGCMAKAQTQDISGQQKVNAYGLHNHLGYNVDDES